MATVEEIQSAAISYADSITADVAATITDMVGRISNIDALSPDSVDTSLAFIDASIANTQASIFTVLPTLESYGSAQAPSVPSLADVTTPSAVALPDFEATAPTLNIPAAPSSSLPAAPGNAPEFNMPALPDRPSFSLPAVPTFASISIPAIQAISIPEFDAVLPVDQLTEPTSVFEFVEQEYGSELLTSIKAKIKSDIENGGYGIDPADEAQMWERMRAREMGALDGALRDLRSQTAARGFVLPPGAMFAAEQMAEQRMLDSIATASREIAIKRADQYVQARQFALSKGVDLETVMLSYAGSKAERALNAARAVVDVGIALYQLRLDKFKTLLASYAQQAQVYETRIRAALAALEALKVQIESARASADVQKLIVSIYLSQLDGIEKMISLYKVDMEAAAIKANIEEIKLRGHQASVQTYVAQVGARETEFKMLEAQIRGELAKVELYKETANAYQARASGAKVKAEAEEAIARAQIAENSQLLDKYRAEADLFRMLLQQITDQNRATLEKAGLSVQIDKLLTDKELARREIITKVSESNANIYASQAKLAADVAQGRFDAFIKREAAVDNIYVAAIESKAKMAAASLQQISTVGTKSE